MSPYPMIFRAGYPSLGFWYPLFWMLNGKTFKGQIWKLSDKFRITNLGGGGVANILSSPDKPHGVPLAITDMDNITPFITLKIIHKYFECFFSIMFLMYGERVYASSCSFTFLEPLCVCFTPKSFGSSSINCSVFLSLCYKCFKVFNGTYIDN